MLIISARDNENNRWKRDAKEKRKKRKEKTEQGWRKLSRRSER